MKLNDCPTLTSSGQLNLKIWINWLTSFLIHIDWGSDKRKGLFWRLLFGDLLVLNSRLIFKHIPLQNHLFTTSHTLHKDKFPPCPKHTIAKLLFTNTNIRLYYLISTQVLLWIEQSSSFIWATTGYKVPNNVSTISSAKWHLKSS